MNDKLWIVGQFLPKDGSLSAWEFQGIFDSEERAIKACINSNYFIGPAELNAEIQETTMTEWPGAYYPHE